MQRQQEGVSAMTVLIAMAVLAGSLVVWQRLRTPHDAKPMKTAPSVGTTVLAGTIGWNETASLTAGVRALFDKPKSARKAG